MLKYETKNKVEVLVYGLVLVFVIILLSFQSTLPDPNPSHSSPYSRQVTVLHESQDNHVVSLIWEENYRGDCNEPCDWAVHCLSEYSTHTLA